MTTTVAAVAAAVALAPIATESGIGWVESCSFFLWFRWKFNLFFFSVVLIGIQPALFFFGFDRDSAVVFFTIITLFYVVLIRIGIQPVLFL